MLQKTLLRLRGMAAPVLILNVALKQRAVTDLAEIGIVPSKIILEPKGRNTAPALAAAALLHAPDDLLLILPSDHDIRNPDVLFDAVRRAAPFAAQGHIIAFGIRPRRVETGFGYIRRGAVVEDGIYRIEQFIEKPPYDIARALTRGGACDWNSGIFLLSAQCAASELQNFQPALVQAVQNSLWAAHKTCQFGIAMIAPGADFASAPSLSIDVAMMEKSAKTLVIPVDLDWADLGTWPALLRRMVG
jgi:mannose-1-phosphate guanylyltransferase/mannose-6-phosphate isomerase